MTDESPTPLVPGQVFVGAVEPFEGQAALLVRTEQRPGSEEPEHFLATMGAGRALGTRWEPVEGFQERWTLAHTPAPEAVEALMARAERDALAATFREVEAVVIAKAEDVLDLRGRGQLALAVVAELRARFAAHRDRIASEGAGPRAAA